MNSEQTSGSLPKVDESHSIFSKDSMPLMLSKKGPDHIPSMLNSCTLTAPISSPNVSTVFCIIPGHSQVYDLYMNPVRENSPLRRVKKVGILAPGPRWTWQRLSFCVCLSLKLYVNNQSQKPWHRCVVFQ